VTTAKTQTQPRPSAAAPATNPVPNNGAAHLVAALEREGVEVVFAYPGGASMPIHQALTYSKIRTILPRHEQGETFMAHGYARATGKVGVCMATSGPGATNLVTGIADAKMDSVPLVCITGQVPTAVIGTDAFQETPMVAISQPITKHAFLVQKAADIPRIVKEAFHIATTGRPGPVLIDVPKDLQNEIFAADFDAPMKLPGYRPHRVAPQEALERAFEFIRNARRPIIYAGGGVLSSGASAELLKFAEATNIPVALTAMGLGSFPARHYLSLGMLGMHGNVYSNMAIDQADVVLAFGVRFDDRVTGKLSEFAKRGKIVHVDIDASEIGKNKEAHVGINGDLRDALARLNALIAAKPPAKDRLLEWHREVDAMRAENPMRYADRDDAILPQYAIQKLAEIAGEDVIITTGVGQHQMWTAQWFPFNRPRTWISSLGLGSMGFGYPAALGAAVACPDKLVVDIDGDGSFLMNVQELATARVENIPAKAMILNNQHLGMVVQWEDRFYAGNRAHTYLGRGHEHEHYPDFVQIAKGFGVPARRVEKKAELPDALREMITTPGPFLLDVAVPYQEHVLPMIPSGKTVKDIIKE
jgi:acetolactate synthase-1/2/3 large subunit